MSVITTRKFPLTELVSQLGRSRGLGLLTAPERQVVEVFIGRTGEPSSVYSVARQLDLNPQEVKDRLSESRRKLQRFFDDELDGNCW